MSRASLEKFLYSFDKEPQRQAAYRSGAGSVFDGFELTEEEQRALLNADVATLYQWGIHPLLIRNFAGTLGVGYVSEYRKRGLK